MTSITTGTGSLHIGDLHSNGSGGENVVWVNTDSNVAYYPSWAGVSVDGATTFPMSARTHGALASAEPAGIASPYTNCDYNTTFTATADVAFFYVDIVAGENYTGKAKWTATKSTGKEVAAFYFDCVATKGNTLRIQFKYPLWIKNGQVFTVTLQKEDGSYFIARSSQQGLQIPYRKTWFRPYTDHNVSTVAFGDTKSSYVTSDHNGWILLNGRAKSSLNAAQQARATSLGFGANIPNGRDRFVVGAGSAFALGSTGGSKTIERSALPNTALTFNVTSGLESQGHTHTIDPPATTTSGESQGHNHTVDPPPTFTDGYSHTHDIKGNAGWDGTNWVGLSDRSGHNTFNERMTSDWHRHTVDIAAFTSGLNNSNHTHTVDIGSFNSGGVSANHTHNVSGSTVSINGGVTQTNFLPEYIALNIFIYLGE